MKNIAIFASGSGSNFQAIVDAVEKKEIQANIRLLVCDKQEAYVIERAKQHGIPSFVFTASDYVSKHEFEQAILKELQANEIELIILAGYMRLIGETLLKSYSQRIVNIHPSLLPQFPGKDAIGQALTAGVQQTGVTVHYVDEGMDTGPIIAQQEISIAANETKESLQEKIHALEHVLYPKTIKTII
ncbi:phosphoribosylglycinamide formyltransferase [Niallia nealsonii]|uniref:Phosphoribosylglycinamide formyltransferase n=1 Tax=Niallia nealsonii TaxID=115979 RepID=A0A2N0Z6M1_9BACI|nr:phosphoribosylglycinamide formyltransferase [Niallia nealsonii]PKG25150.1 phosphoribosylglycinamide formyltransferase [Niallia nealsonii]